MNTDPPSHDRNPDDELLRRAKDQTDLPEPPSPGPPAPPAEGTPTQTIAGDEPAGTIPKRIGQYHVKRVIASGGMGTVYEALQEHPRRTVAVKLMRAGVASRSALRLRTTTLPEIPDRTVQRAGRDPHARLHAAPPIPHTIPVTYPALGLYHRPAPTLRPGLPLRPSLLPDEHLHVAPSLLDNPTLPAIPRVNPPRDLARRLPIIQTSSVPLLQAPAGPTGINVAKDLS